MPVYRIRLWVVITVFLPGRGPELLSMIVVRIAAGYAKESVTDYRFSHPVQDGLMPCTPALHNKDLWRIRMAMDFYLCEA